MSDKEMSFVAELASLMVYKIEKDVREPWRQRTFLPRQLEHFATFRFSEFYLLWGIIKRMPPLDKSLDLFVLYEISSARRSDLRIKLPQYHIHVIFFIPFLLFVSESHLRPN